MRFKNASQRKAVMAKLKYTKYGFVRKPYNKANYNYPEKPSTSLSAISWKMFNISYQETTDAQMRKVKAKFRDLNRSTTHVF